MRARQKLWNVYLNLVEICKAEDMVKYYAGKLKAAKIHLKKLKQE